MEKVKIDLVPFLARALGFCSIVYGDIDKLYSSDQPRFFNAAKSHELYNNKFFRENSAEVEIYSLKALGIIIIAKDDDIVSSALVAMCKKGYKRIYKVAKNCSPNIKNLSQIYKSKPPSGDKTCSDIAAYMFFCVILDKKIQDSTGILSMWAGYFNNKNTALSLIKDKALAKKLYTKIIKKYGKIRCFADITLHNIRKVKFAYFYDLCGELDIMPSTVYEDIKFTEQDIIDIVGLYITVFNDNDIDNIYQHLASAIMFRSLNKLYNTAKGTIRNNLESAATFESEKKQVALLRKRSEVALFDSQKQAAALEKQVALLKKEKADLQKQLEKKEKQLVAANEKQVALFNKMAEQKSDIERDNSLISSLLDNEYIEQAEIDTSKNIVIVGGAPTWQAKIKTAYPSIKFIDNVNFDETIIKNADIICIFYGYLSHSLYYKVINVARKNNIDTKYIKSNNTKLVSIEIGDKL